MPVFANEEEMRAVWISTVFSADFTSNKGNADAQKKEFIEKLEAAKKAGMNTVVVQVRPKADAFYQSSINPWSDLLTGTQGQYPGYDPMAFMIEETHKRNMEFHAWLNPYRITTSGTDLTVLCDTHPARLHPDWILNYKNALYYNPDLMAVKEHIRDTVAEIVKGYDVDGIHFDDYFYPSDYPLPEGETRDGATANARRSHINEMVSMVYKAIKDNKPNVQFGISPMGVWKNNDSDPAGSTTKGHEGYYSVFADATNWIKAGTIDYLVPQIYWQTGYAAADYETLVSWWNNQVTGSSVKLYIGQGIYKDVVAEQITTQLDINKKYGNVKGSFFFSLKDILENRKGCTTSLTAYYNQNTTPDSPSPSLRPTEESSIPTPPPVEPETIPSMPIEEPPTVNETEVITPSNPVIALSTDIKVMVDGKEMVFECYNISDNNYFKLRDLAQALTGSIKQFNVVWEESTQSIDLKTDAPYISAGGELQKGDGTNKNALISNAKLSKNGTAFQAAAYNINDNTYFKLRDLSSALDFAVTWNEETRTVDIITFASSSTEDTLQ